MPHERRKGSNQMIFGRSGAKQGQNPQGLAQEGQQPVQGYGAQQVPWQTTGGTPLAGSYPTQQAGTGYAGYTPGAGGSGYVQGSAPFGQGTGGYAQANAYAQQNQIGTGGYSAGMGYAGQMPAGAGYGAQNGSYASYGSPNAAGTGYAAPTGSGYRAQNGVFSGYSAQNAAGPGGYAGQGTGYAGYGARNAGVPQNGQNNGVQGGYSGQGYPQQNAVPSGYGSYQMPAGQGGYPAGPQGYANMQGQQGYSQGGYNAYAQMGRNQFPPQGQQPDYRQIPLNGGGYVPQPVPIRRQPFVFNDGLLILLSAVLLALFAVGLFVPQAGVLLWVFLALAVGSVLFFWIRPLIAGNKRLCYTIIFGVLSLVALLSAAGILAGVRDSRQTSGQEQTAAVSTGTPGGAGSGAIVDSQTGNVISAVSEKESAATATPAPVSEDNAATDRLESFFRFWSANMQDEMLTLCAPSWQSGVDNPKTALFGLLANRKPLDYTVEKISGTSESTSRTVTVTSTIDRNNGKDPVKYRLSVLMVKESEQWFVDPQSLKTYEEAETPDPATVATATPTAAPATSGSTVLYYNPDGGTKYHLDQNCKSTHAKYLPMKGHFTYAEVNDDKYKNLSPCNVCAAPLR